MLDEFGRNVGVAFQLVDDLLDVIGDERALGKPAGNDIRCGVYTLPVLHALWRGPELRELLHSIQLEGSEVSRAVALVRASDGPATVRELARAYVRRGVEALERVPIPHADAVSGLTGLAWGLIDRTRCST